MPIHIPPGEFDRPEIFLPQMMALLRSVEETIERIRYDRLRGQLLQGVNPEVNTDREALVSRMEQLGFRREIVAALRDLEPKLLAGGKPLDFKTCMDITRTVYEEIVEDAGKKVSTLTGQPLPPAGAKDFQPWKQLLVNGGVLTPEEGELFQKIYNYLSNVGSHRLGSAPEHVRVAKNTVIEWGLLLVGRVQALPVKPAPTP